ncbi:prohibitin family protein [Halosquirtibacter xylanolyticus]|uniref:prohibitin family protein n=1 Tax=Halosquirtibacter xylanolyticus TaxID=3374599 RepID=UPI0037499FD9|nr:prohibitin family protein [Prolixibacteraceae bacterium]
MNKKTITLGVIVFAVLGVIAFGSQLFFTLNPGERGVIFRPYSSGLDKENIYQPGFHIKAPWNTITIYNVKEQKREERMDVLDKNGLSINIDVSVRFNPVYDEIGFLHERFGRNYIDQLVVPEVRSTVRQVAGRYTAEEIYSTKRREVEKSIIEESMTSLEKNHIEMRALLIRSINLPDQIKQAIENKLKQEQEALAYRFKLEREKSEAERKRIEANGIADYNKIISASLSDNVLKQRGIEATLELSKSNNSKVIVVGSSKDGLPLILGNN